VVVFSAAGPGRLVAIEGKMNAAKYREILDENLFHLVSKPSKPLPNLVLDLILG